MSTPAFSRNCMQLMVSAALASMASVAFAASPTTLTISRLTPPSNPVVSGASTLARFLPDQRFDLQATVQPIAGQTISSVEFKVDGVSVGIVTAGATCSDKVASGNKGMLPASAITASVPCAVAASIRAYSNTAAGIHSP